MDKKNILFFQKEKKQKIIKELQHTHRFDDDSFIQNNNDDDNEKYKAV